MGPVHSVLGILRVLAARAGVHDRGAAGDEGQVLRQHPSGPQAGRRTRQRQQSHDRRVLTYPSVSPSVSVSLRDQVERSLMLLKF